HGHGDGLTTSDDRQRHRAVRGSLGEHLVKRALVLDRPTVYRGDNIVHVDAGPRRGPIGINLDNDQARPAPQSPSLADGRVRGVGRASKGRTRGDRLGGWLSGGVKARRERPRRIEIGWTVLWFGDWFGRGPRLHRGAGC